MIERKQPRICAGCLRGLQWRLGAGTAAIALLALSGCSRKKDKPAPPPQVVQVLQVQQRDVPIYHDWIGSMQGFVNAQIRAQVTGYLQTQNYVEGDPVKKDALLFQIDPRPFQAELERTKGQLAQAEAVLGKTELDVKRFAPLATTKAISQEELDDAIQAKLAAAAAVESAKAAVQQAELNLGFTRIISPIDGIASIANAQIGDLVGPSSGELTTVSTLDPIKLYFFVTEQAYINYTRLYADEAIRIEHARQLELQIIFADASVYPREGHIYAVDREINPNTGALRVAALFPNPGNALRPGQFARVRVKFDTRKGALVVPQRAVSELQGAYQVAVVGNENKVHIQPVHVGERTGSDWIIEDGLKPGDRVIVEGFLKIKEGAVVNPQPYVLQASTAPTGGASAK